MSCCGHRLIAVVSSVGTPCPKCKKFTSSSNATTQCPLCKTYFTPKKRKTA